MTSTEPIAKVLVVCLGNICRSPLGEAVLRAQAKQRGLNITVDSWYHVGEDPDDVIGIFVETWFTVPRRSVATCKKVPVGLHTVYAPSTPRIQCSSDFTEFTHILASDESNLRDIKRVMPPNTTADIRLWGSYLDGKSIPDPWYGGIGGFESTFQQCTSLSEAFLDHLTNNEEM
ncbi:phosphotyrosine protein phosphatase I superfamily [Mycena pura]|uniref:Phosphotyrosine protein phosphatase I superfamily n=1 Tax=Mycena pura TaxID=153505 RepID=A0AAD6YPJ2_9AGAR|nr:phosphotyrosine protein phosphatase I superfamily [Mycena pura]